MAQQGLRVGLGACVDALVEQTEEELSAVEETRVGIFGRDERLNDVVRDGLT